MVGIDQSRVSAAANYGKTSLRALLRAARAAGRPEAEIARETGVSSEALAVDGNDPLIGAFMSRLRRLPELESWLEDEGANLTVSEVWRGMATFVASPSLARASDGAPLHGWGPFFADVRAGRLTAEPMSERGTPKLALVAERKQNPGMPAKTTMPRRKKPLPK